MVETALKTIPGYSQGVRVNSAMRMMKLNSPICPNSQKTYTKDAFGNRIEKERGPDEQNCQLAGIGWWLDCEARGHDPYFRNHVWYTTEDIYETDETGRDVLKGQQRIRHEDRAANINQVPLARRMHNGQGVVTSMQKKGRRRLADAGYEECCQFRNCQKSVNPKFHSQAFGDYCSREHLELIASDAKGVLLPQLTGQLETGSEEKIAQRRREMMRQAIYTEVDA